MIRLHLTEADLRNVTVARAPDMMLEIALSMRLLRQRQAAVQLGRWHTWGRARLPVSARPLLALTPPHGFLPDFLAPPGAGDALDDGLDLLLCSPRTLLRSDLEQLAEDAPVPRWAHSLAEGGAPILQAVERSLREYHRAVVAPVEAHLRTQVALAAAHLTHALAAGGLDSALNHVHPDIRWRPPILEAGCLDPDTDDCFFALEGRGLRLQPSFFCHPTSLIQDTGAPFLLTYPLADRGFWAPPPAQSAPPAGAQEADVRDAERALAGLLGATRAAVLRAAASSGRHTTTSLARRTGIAPSTVSHHTTALRAAGLLTTRRAGTSVLHAVTPLGRQLVLRRG